MMNSSFPKLTQNDFFGEISEILGKFPPNKFPQTRIISPGEIGRRGSSAGPRRNPGWNRDGWGHSPVTTQPDPGCGDGWTRRLVDCWGGWYSQPEILGKFPLKNIPQTRIISPAEIGRRGPLRARAGTPDGTATAGSTPP